MLADIGKNWAGSKVPPPDPQTWIHTLVGDKDESDMFAPLRCKVTGGSAAAQNPMLNSRAQ